jgi:hypothetical protein
MPFRSNELLTWRGKMNDQTEGKKEGGAKAGTPVRLRLPPKLLARVDAIVAAQPDPKPRRGQIIKRLMREALRARREKRGARQAAAAS